MYKTILIVALFCVTGLNSFVVTRDIPKETPQISTLPGPVIPQISILPAPIVPGPETLPNVVEGEENPCDEEEIEPVVEFVPEPEVVPCDDGTLNLAGGMETLPAPEEFPAINLLPAPGDIQIEMVPEPVGPPRPIIQIPRGYIF